MKKIDVEELKEIYIQIKNGNDIGFENLYNKYNKVIYGIAFSILKNKEDSEDIVQIFFSKLYSLDKSKLPNSNELSWMYTTTKNEVINLLKKKKNNIDLDSIYEIKDTNNEFNKILDRDSYNRLISKLDNTEKQIISLKIIADLSFHEISRLLNIPTGTVKWKYYKSINTLKILLSSLSMFILTFLSSIFAFKNGKKTSKPMDAQDKQEIIENINRNEEIAGNNREEHKDKLNQDKDEIAQDKETEEQENIMVETPVISDNINYIGIGLISISSIFFIITIIFLIIFTKHQLKRRKKLSK